MDSKKAVTLLQQGNAYYNTTEICLDTVDDTLAENAAAETKSRLDTIDVTLAANHAETKSRLDTIDATLAANHAETKSRLDTIDEKLAMLSEHFK